MVELFEPGEIEATFLTGEHIHCDSENVQSTMDGIGTARIT